MYKTVSLPKKRTYFNSDFIRCLLFAITAFVVSFIPWPDIYWDYFRDVFWDREVYIEKIVTNNHWLNYGYLDSVVSFFSNEYVWELSQWSLSNNFIPLDYEQFFQIITTSCLVSMALVVARTRSYFSFILLFNPIILDLLYSQLRSALALVILNLLYLTARRVNLWVLLGLVIACSIHTASIILIAGYILAQLLSSPESMFSRFSPAAKALAVVGAGLFVGILIGPLREAVLSAVGDRRAEYADLSSSFLYLSFWVALLGFMLINFRYTVNSLEGCFSIFMLSILFVNVFSSAYSIRLIALSMPFIIVAIYNYNTSRKYFILSVFVLYALAQWWYSIMNLTSV